jgi:type II secretory pathway pseudopilin PulG
MSLVELLVSVAILSLGMIVAMVIYQAARESYKRGENETEQQQVARIAFDLISREVRLAGLNLYPDGDKTRPDEAIEAAFARAIVIRADFDGDEATENLNPELALAGGAYATVSTGNDEIHGFVLAKSLPDGTSVGPDSFSFDVDVGQAMRDGAVETVSVGNIALNLNDPPYTLYRFGLDNNSGEFGSAGFVNRTVLADNIRTMRFRYFDRAGNEISAPGGDDTDAAVAARRAIHRVRIELETLTRNPDPHTKDYGRFELVGQVTPRNRGKIRIPDVGSTPFPPGQPDTPDVIPGHCKGLIVDWADNPEHDQVAYYRIRYGTDPFNLDGIASTSGGAYYLSGLDHDTDYTIKIEAYNSADMTSPPSIPVTVRTSNINTPDSPANVQISAGSNGGLELSWDAVTRNEVQIPDTVLRDLSGYRLYRATSPGVTADVSNLHVDESTLRSYLTPVFVDRQTVSCRSYHYALTAIDTCGVESVIAPEVSGQVTSTTRPRTPPSVHAFFDGGDIRLQWQTVLNDVDGKPIWVEDYKIYRTDPTPLMSFPMAPVGFFHVDTVSGVNEYVDPPPSAGYRYWYAVTAIDDCGNESGWSQITTPRCSFNGNVVFDEPDHDEQKWPTARLDVRVASASGTYEELRLQFSNESDGSRYSERLSGPGPDWTYVVEGPGVGLFTEGWYSVVAEVDQFDGAIRCTSSGTRRFYLSDD